MNTKIKQGLEWLDKEIKKDQVEIDKHKNELIKEIKSLDKNKIFEQKQVNKKSLTDKLKKIFGYE